jgi:TP901 family phage tail tape measure protein
MSSVLKVQWHLELVDAASSKMLRSDRQIRTSLSQTERAQAKLAKVATETGQARVRGATQTASALTREGRAAAATDRDVARLNRSQAQALSANSRLASSARGVADAYRGQAAAARQLSAAERAREAASRGASRVAGGATMAGAGLTRGTQTAIGVAAGGGIAAKAVSIFAGFEQQMDRVAAVTGATSSQMRDLGDQAKQLGADTSFSAREAADGMYQLSTAGFKVDEVMRTLPGTLDLAAASGTDLSSAAALQAAALRGFGLDAGKASHVADVLAKAVNVSAIEMSDLGETLPYVASTARQTGTSFEQVAAAAAILGNAGIKGSAAGTALRTSMLRLTDPSKKMRGVLHELGLGGRELAALPLPEVIGKVADGLSRLPTQGERIGAVSALFGKESASSILNLLSAGSEGINKITAELQNADGYGRKAGKTMRDNVAGGWDAFTGSIETAAITLTERFGPALKGALRGAASGVNAVAGLLGDVGAGAMPTPRSPGPTRAARLRSSSNVARRRDAQERTATRQHADDDPSTARRIGATLANVAGTVGRAASSAGAQLLEAFRPALPFFQNILLPLLEGVGKGILVSVVGAFKVLVPIIRGVSSVLGAIGDVAKPLAPVFRGIGTVIGFVAGGPILKLIAGFGKLGFVGKAVAGVARVLLIPIRAVGSIFGALGGLIGRAVGRAVGAASKLARGIIVTWATMPLRVANIAASIGSRLIGGLGRLIGGVRSTGSKIASAIIGGLVRLPGRIGELASRLATSMIGLGRKLVTAIIDGVKAAPGAVIDALKDLVPAPLRKAASAIFGGRRGGTVSRRGGGLIPSAVSPGELVTYGTASWMVPGARTGADSVTTLLPAGAAVWTDHGQQLLAAGMDPAAALVNQMPHFRTGGEVLNPGQMATLAYKHGRAKGMTTKGAVRMGAYGMRESRGNTRAHNYDPPRDDSWGLWQINVLPNANPRFKSWKLENPDRNAEAMSLLYKAAGERPWGGYPESSITPYLPAAARGFGKGTGALTSDSSSDSTLKVPIYSGRSKTRAGVLEDALAQGRTAGQEGLTRHEIRQAARGIAGARANPLIAAIRGAQATTTRELTVKGRGSSSSTASLPGGVYVPNTSWNPRRKPIARWIAPYLSWGSGHGWDGTVSSGFRSRAEQTRIYNSGVRPAARPGTSNHEGSSYPRGAVDVTKAALLAAVLLRRPGPHLLQYAGAKDPVHFSRPHGGSYRRGGRVGYRPGGVVAKLTGGGATPLRTQAAGVLPNIAAIGRGVALTNLDEAIGAAAELRIRRLRDDLLKAIRRGGSKQTIQRLQGALSLIEGELGRRIGELERAVDTRTARLERGRGQYGRDQRRLGVDADSLAGLRSAAAFTASREVPGADENIRDLRAALGRARRAGAGKQTIAELQAKLNAAQDELDEVLVSQVERNRQIIRQAAQEFADQASFGLEYTQGGLSGLDIAQRAAGTADSASGLLERAGAIQTALIPAIQAGIDALFGQYVAAIATGDAAGIRSSVLAIQGAGNDLAAAIADAAQLTRDAAKRGAQENLDEAAFGVEYAQGNLAGLDAIHRQRGMTDTPGALLERASAIRANTIPALERLLQNQHDALNVAQNQGDVEGVRSALLAIQSSGTDLANAITDAAELTRDAAQRAAQDRVDAAASATTLAGTGLQRLELEQKLAGTFDTGGVARAQYVQATVIPALQAELVALREQERRARETGTLAELRAAIEAESAKQNEILAAQLEVQEGIQDNTGDRKFGGTLGFGYGGGTLTDALIAAGNGA